MSLCHQLLYERAESKIFFPIFVSAKRDRKQISLSQDGNKRRILVIAHTGRTGFSYTSGTAFLELNRHSYRRLISRGPVENVNSWKMPGNFVYSDMRDNHDVLLLIHPLNSPYFFLSCRKIGGRNLHRDTLEESFLQAQLIYRRWLLERVNRLFNTASGKPVYWEAVYEQF